MTALSLSTPSLCSWKENRGGLRPGIQSILNVLYNRAKRDNTTMYAEAVKHIMEHGKSVGQFSSMTTTGDPELVLWPDEGDPQYALAEQMAQQALDGDLPDITSGSTLYFAPHSIKTSKTFTLPDGSLIPFPEDWNPAVVKYTVTIENQVFFTE